jgi:spore maturation protein CgeB
VLSGTQPSPEAGPQALARALDHLLNTPSERQRLGRQARETIAQNHLTDAATDTFWSAITPLLERSA